MKKILLVVIALAFIGSTLTGCSSYKALDKTIEGSIDVMMWSGDGTYIEDLGHKDLAPEDLKGQNNASVYAVAKAFNAIYPNVKINVYAKSGGPGTAAEWVQEIENFKVDHGKYPDLYAAMDLPGDIARGFVADLSVFSSDPLYKSFNKSILGMMNYYGFQAGLPQFLQPWGIYVNKALAEDYNIEVPEANWTIDEYTDFITSAKPEDGFYGAMDVDIDIIRTGVTTIEQQMKNYSGTGDYVNLASDEVKALLDYVPEWASVAVWAQNDAGNVSGDFMNAHWWWGHKMFADNVLLTNAGDPWMMGDCANPEDPWGGSCKSSDWDIYPRPSTDYQDNTVGVVLDPMAVYNHCMDDGDAACTTEENAATKLAYTFTAFMAGDTAAWQARADQTFLDGTTVKSAMNDSLPFVTGKAFDEQMEIWYQPAIHNRFADAAKMPGWHLILDIWEKGQVWAISDKAALWFYTENGEKKTIISEFLSMNNPEIAGATRVSPSFPNEVKARLADWNTSANERFQIAETALRDALKEFYGFKDADFK
jgi:hypothetical protein